MGSDLAHRPSENAPTNCDSSESEKSNDSPSMRGVWKSGSNCNRKVESADENSQNSQAQTGEIKQDPGLGLEDTSKTCGHPQETRGREGLTKTPCVFE